MANSHNYQRSEEAQAAPGTIFPLPRRRPGAHSRAWRAPHSHQTLSRVADALRRLPGTVPGKE